MSPAPYFSWSAVCSSSSLPNWEKTCISRYCAKSRRMEPTDFFITFVCAAPPTRDTERPTLTAGRWPE